MTPPLRRSTVLEAAMHDAAAYPPGKVWHVKTDGLNTYHGRNWDGAVKTIQKAVDLASDGDFILVAAGAYDETVTVDKAVMIKAIGPRGSTFIEPSAAGAEGMSVIADDVTLVNIGVDGDDTADYALRVGSQTVSPARFRAYGCKFELGGGAAAAVILKGAGDVRFKDCEFAWAGKGLTFDDNDNGFVTQVYAEDCVFHNIATASVTVETDGLVKNLNMLRCTFDNNENGVAPTDYILLSSNDHTGVIAGCTFATATNATSVLTIGTGLKWVANMTEAGVSTARPA